MTTRLFARLAIVAGALVRPLCTPTEPLGLEFAGDQFVVDDNPQPLIPVLIQRPTSPRTASRIMSLRPVDPPVS